ncbi:hypothetical protein BDV18DRAFT_54425 [Aspergillus unguis]
MVAPTFVLQVGCFFGFLTCDTPRGVWPEDRPTVVSPWPPGAHPPGHSDPPSHPGHPGHPDPGHTHTSVPTTFTDTTLTSLTTLTTVTTRPSPSDSTSTSEPPTLTETQPEPPTETSHTSEPTGHSSTFTSEPSSGTSTATSGETTFTSETTSQPTSGETTSTSPVPTSSETSTISSVSSSDSTSLPTSSETSSETSSVSSSDSTSLPTSSESTSSESTSSETTSSETTSSETTSSLSTSSSTSVPVIPTTSTSSTPSTPTMSVTSTSTSLVPTATATSGTLAANILVIARDDTQASVASSGLNGYGIPYTTLLVPQGGVELPALNSSSGGNFGGIVIAGEVSYDNGGSWGSALTTDQWNQLYAYQLEYGVRMVQYDVFPGPDFGASAVGDGCCADGVEQELYFSDVSDFPTSGLRTGSSAGVSTQGLWHYPATISNSSTTKAIANFAAGGSITDETVAAVINNFEGRQQMVFFIGFDTVWSQTSTFLQHAWITWITRGLHAGHRRVNLNTQIDDVFLETDIYYPAGPVFRITADDLAGITSWLPTIRGKLNAGSTYFVELGHNGNGNIEASTAGSAGEQTCSGGAIEYDSPPDTALEFQKPLGTGTNLWPTSPTTFVWTNQCLVADPLLVWLQDNLNEFAHISHTFTHLEQNNATYSDVNKEISFNQVWLNRVGIDSATRFTSNGIIPPAITGLHNGDALRAWSDNGITNCVGDNTRPALLNSANEMWPYFTNVGTDGFDGMQVNPRYATRIYYNCDTPACTVQEWIDTSAGAGGFDDLLDVERSEVLRHLLGLHHDGYMFHQANLRNADTDPVTVNGETGQYSIFQAWVETIVQEFVRLVEWPIVTTTHEQMSSDFFDRYTRDQCNYQLAYTLAEGSITGVTVTADGNTCGAPIPITFPDAPSDTQGFSTEQLGSDPVTVWAQLSGSPVEFSLASPIALN